MGPDAELQTACRWWLTVFGRIRFFPQYLKMAQGRRRGAIVVSLPQSTAERVRRDIEATKDASGVTKHLSFCELDGDDQTLAELLEKVEEEERPTLLRAIGEARPQEREYVVVANIFTDDRTTAASISWAVVRDEPSGTQWQ